jgi:hypothetical protein
MNPARFLQDGRPFGATKLCDWGMGSGCSKTNTWYLGENGDAYAYWYRHISNLYNAGYRRVFINALMGTPDGDPVVNLLGAWDSHVIHNGTMFHPPLSGGSAAVVRAISDARKNLHVDICVALRWSLPLSSGEVAANSSDTSLDGQSSSDSSGQSSSDSSGQSSSDSSGQSSSSDSSGQSSSSDSSGQSSSSDSSGQSSSSSSFSHSIKLNYWHGSARPNLLQDSTKYWLESNLRPLIGHVSCLALYGVWGSDHHTSMAECMMISSYILKEFGMLVLWLDPDIGDERISSIPSWFFSLAPSVVRYGRGSRLEKMILVGGSPPEGSETHIILRANDSLSDTSRVIVGRFGEDVAPSKPLSFGAKIDYDSNGFIVSKLVCDSRTLSGSLSRLNGFLSSQARGSSLISPCFRVSCALDFHPDEEHIRSYIPAWWLTAKSASGCVDRSATHLVANSWTSGVAQADLRVASPYGTVGAEKAADLAFDLALTLSSLSHGASASMRSRGISLAFESFGTPLSEGFCDLVSDDAVDCYPFLLNHPADALISFSDPSSRARVFSSNPYATPFVDGGLSQTRAWMKDFVSRWCLRSHLRLMLSGSDPFVPWLSFVSFEPVYYSRSEYAAHIPIEGGVDSCRAGEALVGYWPGIEDDSRYSLSLSNSLPFKSLKQWFDSASVMCDIVGRDGSPQGSYRPQDVDYKKDAKKYASNRAFSLWFDGMSRQVALDSIRNSAFDILSSRFTECRFVAPGLATQQGMHSPDISSAFVADSQGVVYDAMMLGSYSPKFDYISIAQFGNSTISSEIKLPVGAYSSYEVRGDRVLKDGSNRSDWRFGLEDRMVLIGKQSKLISSRDMYSSRHAMSHLHRESVVQHVKHAHESGRTIVCMPMVGLSPKGGTGDIRSGQTSAIVGDYSDTKYHIYDDDFKLMLNSADIFSIYDLDVARSRAEWDRSIEIIENQRLNPPNYAGLIEVADAARVKFSFVGSRIHPLAVNANIRIGKDSNLLIMTDSQKRELFRHDVKGQSLSTLAAELAPLGVDVHFDPSHKDSAVDMGDLLEIHIPKSTSKYVSIKDGVSAGISGGLGIELFLTSPDPINASRVSRGGFASVPMRREVGALRQGIGAGGTTVLADCPNFDLDYIMIGKELVEASCRDGNMSLKRRMSPAVHIQGTKLYFINSKLFSPLSVDTNHVVRCLALMNMSAQSSGKDMYLEISGVGNDVFCAVTQPKRQGFIFSASSIMGSVIAGVDVLNSMRSGDIVCPWPSHDIASRYMVSSMSGSRLELMSRLQHTVSHWWCMPSPSAASSISVVSSSDLYDRYTPEGGVISAPAGNLDPAECVYFWIVVPKRSSNRYQIQLAVRK